MFGENRPLDTQLKYKISGRLLINVEESMDYIFDQWRKIGRSQHVTGRTSMKTLGFWPIMPKNLPGLCTTAVVLQNEMPGAQIIKKRALSQILVVSMRQHS